MKLRTNLHILGTALLFASAVGFAGEETTDSTQFQVRTANGQVEKVSVENLEVGQVRTVKSERGTTVVVGRHERGYVLDVAGERIEVSTPEMTEEEIVLHHEGGHDKHMVIKMGEHDQDASAAGAHQRRVVVIKRDGADSKTIRIGAGDDAEKIAGDVDLNDPAMSGKRVVVVRKVEKKVQ